MHERYFQWTMIAAVIVESVECQCATMPPPPHPLPAPSPTAPTQSGILYGRW